MQTTTTLYNPNKKVSTDYIPKDLLEIEPFSRQRNFVSKKEIMATIDAITYQLKHVNKRLTQINQFSFVGRIETNETKRLKKGKTVLEEDLLYLKQVKRNQFEQKRGPKPKYR